MSATDTRRIARNRILFSFETGAPADDAPAVEGDVEFQRVLDEWRAAA